MRHYDRQGLSVLWLTYVISITFFKIIFFVVLVVFGQLSILFSWCIQSALINFCLRLIATSTLWGRDEQGQKAAV